MNPGPGRMYCFTARDGGEGKSANIKRTIHTPGHTVGSCCFVGGDDFGILCFEAPSDEPISWREAGDMVKSLSRLMTYDDNSHVGENTDVPTEKSAESFCARG